MAQDVLITPGSTKVAFTDSGDVTTVLRTSSGRFEFKDSGESSFVDLYANDIVLDGNLTVGGTTTTVNTSNVLIEDPILQLAKGQTSGSPTVDIGFLGLRGSSNNAGFIWDESDDVFAAILTTSDGSGTTLTPASYAGFKAGQTTIDGGGATQAANTDADDLVVRGDGNRGISVITGTNKDGRIVFSDTANTVVGGLRYDHNVPHMQLLTEGSVALTLDGSQSATFAGVIKGAAGSVGAPAIILNGDTDTGFYYSGANDMGVSVAGTLVGRFVSGSFKSGGTNGGWKLMTSSGAGSAGLPVYAFEGDTDTGMYRDGVNGLGFSTAGTARLTINSSGNATFSGDVGIGVTPETWHSSYTALQFAGNGALSGWGNQQAGAAIYLSQNSYLDQTAWKYISTDEASRYEQVNGTHTFSVATSGTADAAITWIAALALANTGAATFSGNLHIKTDDAFLDIKEADGTAISYLGDHTGAGVGALFLYNHGGTKTVFLRADADDSYINTGGQFGIGTATPEYKLELSFAAGNHTTGMAITNTQAGGYGNALNFVSKRSDDSSLNIAAQIRTEGASSWNTDASTSTNLKFETVSADTLATRMTIFHDGNIGIGTSAPAAPLHVLQTSGDDNDTGLIVETTNSAERARILLRQGSSIEDFIFNLNSTGMHFGFSSSTQQFNINSSGCVGIGTISPGGLLHVYGSNSSAGDLWTQVGTGNAPNITIQNASATDNTNAALFFKNDSVYVGSIGMRFTNHSSDAAQMRFSTTSGGTTRERMTLDESGKLGIGTTAPGGFLSVEGAGNSRGIFVAATGATTYSAIQAEADALTTGSVARFSSNSATTSTRYLVNIINDNALATAAVGLRIQQDSTAPALVALGNVGIGTTAPDCLLNIEGQSVLGSNTNAGSGVIQLGNGPNVRAFIDYDGYNGNTILYIKNNYIHNNSSLKLQVGDKSNLMVLKGSGSVGIGTSAPAYGLDVRNTIYTAVAATTINLTLGDTTNGKTSAISTNNENLIFYHDGSNESMRINSAGKVGIGETSPGSYWGEADDLVIKSASGNTTGMTLVSNSTSGSCAIAFADGTSGNATYRGRIEYNHNSDHSLDKMHLGAGASTTLTLDWVGNVGIGTTAPVAKLDVLGTTGTVLRLSNEATSHEQAPHLELRAGPGGSVYGDNWIRFVDYSESKSWALGMDDDLNVFSLTYQTDRVAGPTASSLIAFNEDGTIDTKTNYIVNEQGRQDHVANTLPSPYYRFNGKTVDTNYVDCGTTGLLQSQDLTIVGWFRPDSAQNSTTGVVTANDTSTNRRGLEIAWSGEWYFTNNSSRGVIAPTDVKSGVWQHVAGTVISNTGGNTVVKLYVNGVEVDSDSATAYTVTPTNKCLIADLNSTNRKFSGEIKGVRIYNVALDSTEVKEAYSGASVPFKYKGANQTELATNGTFASDTGWTKGTGWTITGGKAVATSAANDSQFYQSRTYTVGKLYRAVFEISGYSAGAVYASMGGAGVLYPSGSFAANGTYTYIFVAASASDYINFVTVGTTTLDIEYVTLVQIGAVAEYDGSGMTGATWYDKSGNNLDGTVTGASLENRATALIVDDRVGIGTTTPDTNLQIVDPTINSKDILHLKTSADSVGDYLGIRFTSGVGGAGPHAAIRTYGGPSSGDSYISLLTTTDGGTLVQGLTQDKNGSVGIGTTVPSTKLEIGGMASPALKLTSSSDSNYNVKISANYSFANPANITGVNGANIISMHGYNVKVGGSGSVGIGTTAPTSKLHVNGSGAVHGQYLRISNGTTQIYELQPSIVNVTNNGFGIYDVTDSLYRLVIDTSGNVGIGVVSPPNRLTITAPGNADPLHVYGSGNYGIKFTNNGTNFVSYIRTFESSTLADNYMSFGVSTGNNTTSKQALRFKGDGTHDHYGNRIVNSHTVSDSHRTPEPSLRFTGGAGNGGTNDYVNIGTTTNYGSKATFSVWVKFDKLDAPTSGREGIIGSDYWAADNFSLHLHDNSALWFTAGANIYSVWSTAGNITVDTWHHLSLVYDSTESTNADRVRLYIDGVLRTAASVAGTYSGELKTNNGLKIGWAGQHFHEGEIKDVRIHNRAFSAADAAAAYNGESISWKYNDSGNTSLAVASAANPDNETNAVGNFTSRNSSTVSSSATTWTGSHGSYAIKAVITANNSGIWGNQAGTAGATGASVSAVPDGTLTIGRRYRLSYSINNVDITASIAQEVYTGTTNAGSKSFTGTGIHNHSLEFTATGTSLYFALVGGDNSQTRTLYLDNWKLVEVGEIAAYTPQSITSGKVKGSSITPKWNDTTSNANHGSLVAHGQSGDGPTMVGTHNLGPIRSGNNGYVGIGTATPYRLLEVKEATAGGTLASIAITAAADGQSSLWFADVDDGNIGGLMYTHSNNQLEFRVNDATRIAIKSDGNVGIGTTAPATKLHINITDTVSSASNLRIQAPIYPSIEFYSTNTASNNRNWKISSVYNSYGTFEIISGSVANGVPNVPRFAIDKDGKVGIGTTAPGALLHVNGTSLFSGVVEVGSGTLNTGITPKLTVFDTKTLTNTTGDYKDNHFVIADLQGATSGNNHNDGRQVGIGFAVSTAVGGYPTTISCIRGVKVGTGNNHQTGELTFHTSGSPYWGMHERMRINYTGNVGIGTDSPLSRLDIRTDSTTLIGAGATLNIEEASDWSQGLAFYINDADAYNGDFASASIGVANSSNNIIISAGARVVNNTNSGNAYTTLNATAPSVYRQVDGSHRFYSDTGKTANAVYTPTERMRIKTDGNVGIGTNAPIHKLHVKGNLCVDYGRGEQRLSGSTTCNDNAWTEIAYVSHSFMARANFWAYQTNSLNGGALYDFGVAYGNASATRTFHKTSAEVLSVEAQYLNSGGSTSYIIRVRVNLNSASSCTVFWTLDGNANAAWYKI